jgi:hypothetical protein
VEHLHDRIDARRKRDFQAHAADPLLMLGGAHLGLFDSHQLFTDMISIPAAFFDGAALLTTSEAVHECVYMR